MPHSSLAASPGRAGGGTAESPGLKVRHGPDASAKYLDPQSVSVGPVTTCPARMSPFPGQTRRGGPAGPRQSGQAQVHLTPRVPTSSL